MSSLLNCLTSPTGMRARALAWTCVIVLTFTPSTHQFAFKRSLALLPARTPALRMAPCKLSLEEFAMELATMRAQYLQASGLSDEAVCRMILTTRMTNLNLFRCESRESTISGAGRGLFVTRDIEGDEMHPDCPPTNVDAQHLVNLKTMIMMSSW